MIIVWIIIGGIAGSIASLLVGEDNGCAMNIVLGMLGSLIGGAIEMYLSTGNFDLTLAFTDFNLTSILVSTIGAVILIGFIHIFKTIFE